MAHNSLKHLPVDLSDNFALLLPRLAVTISCVDLLRVVLLQSSL